MTGTTRLLQERFIPTISSTSSNLDLRPEAVLRPEDRKLSDQFQSYWTNFAKTGDPNGSGSAEVAHVSADGVADDASGQDERGETRCSPRALPVSG